MKQIIKAMERELDIINRQIDMKIIIGRSYKNDAIRHKMLLCQLKRIKSRDEQSFFGNFFGGMVRAITSFIF